VAELECGHDQHVRHDPPWTNRPWTTTADGRERALGSILDCKKCDEGAPRDGRDAERPPHARPARDARLRHVGTRSYPSGLVQSEYVVEN
jgi:hypothetical protein